MLREAQSARKRQGKADKGRNRAQTAEKGRKGPEKGPKSRVFFFWTASGASVTEGGASGATYADVC
jgi:hypothetical protein